MIHILLECVPLFAGVLAGTARPFRIRSGALRVVTTSLLIGTGWPLIVGEIGPDILASALAIGVDVFAAAAGFLAMNFLSRRQAPLP